MAKAYFLNAQNENASIQVNGALDGQTLAPLNAQPPKNPFGTLEVQAVPDKNVLGTDGAINTIVVTSVQGGAKTWHVSMDTSITAMDDIQLLVFDNRLLARQGNNVNGFTIKPSN